MNSISKIIQGIGAKRLSDVEVNPNTSNQHEFNGISKFKEIFGEDRQEFIGKFVYLGEKEDHIVEDSVKLTWYDARENHATRTEYRLYYKTNAVIGLATPGDLLIIAKTANNSLVIIITPKNSTSERQMLMLFDIQNLNSDLIVRDLKENDIQLTFAQRYVLSLLGFDTIESKPNYLETLLSRFGPHFPSTETFSTYARSTIQDVSPIDNPDEALITWLEQEEMLFKTLEEYIVAKKLEEGFGKDGLDVDEFISFSLSVQNRRKSRAGLAFEHHLAFIFSENLITFSKGAITERNNKPDFIFPGIQYYQDPAFSELYLTMLGVKTTAKDRWRQVLTEADRIKRKHLITVEPAISKNQTDEMAQHALQLVLPEPVLQTYTPDQQKDIINLADFIELVRERQKYTNG